MLQKKCRERAMGVQRQSRCFLREKQWRLCGRSGIWTELWMKRTSQVALVVKKLPANAGDAGDAGLIPEWGSPGGGHSNPLQCSYLENPMDRGAWQATVHRIAKSRTQLKLLSMHIHEWRKGRREWGGEWWLRRTTESASCSVKSNSLQLHGL